MRYRRRPERPNATSPDLTALRGAGLDRRMQIFAADRFDERAKRKRCVARRLDDNSSALLPNIHRLIQFDTGVSQHGGWNAHRRAVAPLLHHVNHCRSDVDTMSIQ